MLTEDKNLRITRDPRLLDFDVETSIQNRHGERGSICVSLEGSSHFERLELLAGSHGGSPAWLGAGAQGLKRSAMTPEPRRCVESRRHGAPGLEAGDPR